jgi:hypothetical protein
MPDDSDYARREETPAAIPDLCGQPLARILGAEDTVLSNAVRRRLQDVKQPGEPWSAHGTTP